MNIVAELRRLHGHALVGSFTSCARDCRFIQMFLIRAASYPELLGGSQGQRVRGPVTVRASSLISENESIFCMEYSTDLCGKRIVVVGASGAIGSAISRKLAALGATLVLVGRRESAIAEVASSLANGPHVIVPMDISDESSWESQFGPYLEPAVNALVVAAGTLGPAGKINDFQPEQFMNTVKSNVVGTVLAVKHLLSRLAEARGSIVTFSGGGATSPLPFFSAYAASKVAVVRLTEQLSIELVEQGVRINAVAPGFVYSAMHDETLAFGPEAVGRDYFEKTRSAAENGTGDSPELAANLCAFLTGDESVGITGKLISARWDPWQETSFQDRLRGEKGFATIRRIDGQEFDVLARQSS